MTGPIVLIVIAAIIGANARDGLFEKAVGPCLRYAAPIPQRVTVLLFGVSFFWAAYSLGPVSKNWVFDLFFVALALGCFYAAGPREALIDRARKTYVVKSGWPLVPNLWNGTFEDMAQLRITRVTSGYNTTYQLALRWKMKRGDFVLGKFGTRERALASAAAVLNAWGISLPVEQFGAVNT